jgi:hypothetical protein
MAPTPAKYPHSQHQRREKSHQDHHPSGHPRRFDPGQHNIYVQ